MTIEANENRLSGNREQLNNSPLSLNKPPIDSVDELADELATDYSNPNYRTWYCGVIYEFGIEKVRYWQQKASNGNFPGKLFGYYVRQARSGKVEQPRDNSTNSDTQSDIDTVYPVRGDETDEELLNNMRGTLDEEDTNL